MSMDEQSGNLADETTEMMSESVAHQNEELRKRRSTRIMQAVPLAVTGVDALGRPFTERTSTLIINCHGCRYQSKHYVLKNMWVTLEVPHPETGQAPRAVRGRVAWIQRPRTVRQLFQVALELEVPGNTWGIAFPPPDWFAPSEAGRTASASYTGAQDVSPRTSETAEIHLPLTEPEPTATVAQDNLRIFPAPASTTDASLQLARHMARLMADAKQQIQATAREVAAQAVGAERRVSIEEWEHKISSCAGTTGAASFRCGCKNSGRVRHAFAGSAHCSRGSAATRASPLDCAAARRAHAGANAANLGPRYSGAHRTNATSRERRGIASRALPAGGGIRCPAARTNTTSRNSNRQSRRRLDPRGGRDGAPARSGCKRAS